MEKRKIVLVSGMHRSGTSVLTAGLQTFGFELGTDLIPADEENPKGYFEDATITLFNERLLESLGLSWNNPFFLGRKIAFQKIDKSLYLDAIDLIQRFTCQNIAVKDPRISLLLPFWTSVLSQFPDAEIYLIHVVRNPLQVAGSLKSRGEKNPKWYCGDWSQSLLLWYSYIYSIVTDNRFSHNLVVDHKHLMEKPGQVLGFLAENLGVDLCSKAKKYVDEFIDVSMIHHRATRPVVENEVELELLNIYSGLRQFSCQKKVSSRMIKDALEPLFISTSPLMIFLKDDVACSLFRSVEDFYKSCRLLKEKSNVQQAELQRYEEEKRGYESELLSLRAELQRYEDEKARQEDALERAACKQSLLESKIHYLLQENSVLENKLKAESVERQYCYDKVEALFESTSWRITRPMRVLKQFCMDPRGTWKKASSILAGGQFSGDLVITAESQDEQVKHIRPPRGHREREQRYLSGQTVLFVGHDASQTGAPKVLLDLVQWFRDHTALDIRLVLINGGIWQDRFRDIAETLILSELQDLPDEEVTKKIYDFAGSAVKCVYLNTVASAPFLSFWKREDVPLFAHIHEMRDSIARLFFMEISQMAVRVQNYIAVSPPVLDGLMQLTGIDEESSKIVYPFITPSDTVLPVVDNKKTIRNTFGLPADRFIVIGCGVIYARKGVDLFLECARKVIEVSGEQPLFVWIGGGYGVEDLPAMEQLAEQFGITEHVIFTGPVDDPRRYFQAGDLFLMTSREDPFPLVCLEAAERGLPVICFADAGGMPLFVEEDAGFVVPYLDTDLMADRVIRLQNDIRLCRSLGDCGRRKVLEKYTVENAGLEIIAYLRKEAGIKPAVSVIVPNYNHFPYLRERLESIYNQSFQDIEVILLDDASTDKSIDILDSYQEKYPYITKAIYNDVNSTSVFKQWEKGINQAKGDLVWIAESDDFCAGDFLHQMLPQMADQTIMLGYCQSYCLDGEKDAALTYIDMGYYDNLDRTRWQKNYICSGTEEITRFMVVKNIIPNVSSTIVRNIGIANILPELSNYKISGDWVFYLRHIEGGKISYLAQPLNYHRVHAESVVRANRNKILFQEFGQVHRMVSGRYTLDRNIKEKMISYVNDAVYAAFGKNLDLALEAVYNNKSIQEARPPGNYEGKSSAVSLQIDLKPIAFYLPQFHVIPENDQWWGKGFTEWTNTRQGNPLFTNHFQPRIPHEDIGYYDLSDWRMIKKQTLLARQYGIYGFCFYHYWFRGKRLLGKPVNNFLDHPEIEFPFCLCWANENWTRRWDGKDSEILIAQNHSAADDISFIEDLSRYLKDSRYIHIQDKPLVLIYRPELFPEPGATANRWRQWCRKNGIGEIYLAYMDAFTNPDNPQDINFDAKIEFPPNTGLYSEVLITPEDMDDEFTGWILSYPAYVRQLILNRKRKISDYPLFRTVMLAWDNTARRKKAGTVFADFSTLVYREWLRDTIAHTRAELTENQRFFFINAWNEWAEGTYLEPDRRLGYACLNATLEELQRNS